MLNVVKAFAIISIGGFLFGYIIGATSNIISPGQLLCHSHGKFAAVPEMTDTHSLLQVAHKEFVRGRTAKRPEMVLADAGHGSWTSFGYRQCYNLADWEKGLMSSLNLIGAVMSSLFCFRYADGMGRRLELQVGAVLYFLGSAIAALSPCLLGTFCGLLVYGFGIGFGMHVAPIFVGEIAPADKRGGFIAAKEAVVVFGMVCGFAGGCIFGGTELIGWRCMAGVATIPAAIMGVGASFILDSPRWLALKGNRDAAEKALQFYQAGTSSEETKEELVAIGNDAQKTVTNSWYDAFSYPKPLFIGCGMMMFQQVTGQPSLLYYAKTVFLSAGIRRSAAFDSLVLGLVKFVATLGSAYYVDRFGRRPMLFLGISVMAIALVMTAASMHFRNCATGAILEACAEEDVVLPHPWNFIMLLAITTYVVGYQIGFGPIGWLMVSEVFPLQVRGAALSLAAIVNFSSNVVMTLGHPTLLNLLGPAGIFLSYSWVCLVSLAFVWRYVPETRNKTLEEINKMLASSE